MNKTGGHSARASRSLGTVAAPVVLVVGAISLFATLATFVMMRFGYGDVKTELLANWFVGLLFLAFVLAMLTPLALIAIAIVALLRGGSRAGGSRVASVVTTSDPPRAGASRVSTSTGATLENKAWADLVEECVDVVDELDRHMVGFDPPRREVAGHVILRLQEILGRSGVEVITGEATYDRSRHKPERSGTTIPEGALISETLSPGFAVGRRVLRRARVRVDDV